MNPAYGLGKTHHCKTDRTKQGFDVTSNATSIANSLLNVSPHTFHRYAKEQLMANDQKPNQGYSMFSVGVCVYL